MISISDGGITRSVTSCFFVLKVEYWLKFNFYFEFKEMKAEKACRSAEDSTNIPKIASICCEMVLLF